MTDDIKVGLVRVGDIRFHPHNIRRDLGDLRTLIDSIRRFGIMQPVVVEHHLGSLRLRAGHRRVAAARLAGVTRIPAVIHAESLDDDEWLINSVQENVMRRNLDRGELQRAVVALRALGCSWDGVAAAFGVPKHQVQKLTQPPQPKANSAKWTAVTRLIAAHRAEYDRYLAEAKQTATAAAGSAA